MAEITCNDLLRLGGLRPGTGQSAGTAGGAQAPCSRADVPQFPTCPDDRGETPLTAFPPCCVLFLLRSLGWVLGWPKSQRQLSIVEGGSVQGHSSVNCYRRAQPHTEPGAGDAHLIRSPREVSHCSTPKPFPRLRPLQPPPPPSTSAGSLQPTTTHPRLPHLTHSSLATPAAAAAPAPPPVPPLPPPPPLAGPLHRLVCPTASAAPAGGGNKGCRLISWTCKDLGWGARDRRLRAQRTRPPLPTTARSPPQKL